MPNHRRLKIEGGTRIAMRTGSEAPKYLLGDHLGSTSVMVNADGTQVSGSPQGYMPWGETRFGGVGTEYQYTGQYRDGALGLDYYGARWYDSYLNRWTSPDTIIPDPNNSLDWDRYSYARNNPIVYVDPSGHFPWLLLLGVALVLSQIPSDQPQSDPERQGDPAVMLVGLSLLGPLGDAASTAVECASGPCDPTLSMLPGPNPSHVDEILDGTDNVVDGVDELAASVDEISTRGIDPSKIFIPSRKVNQFPKRGWSLESIRETVANPAMKRSTLDNPEIYNWANDNPVTYYYTSDGHYVVIDNVTGDVIQVSNQFDLGWIDPFTDRPIEAGSNQPR